MKVSDIKNTKFKSKIAYISNHQLPAYGPDKEQLVNTVSALAAEGVNIKLVIPKKWRSLFTNNDIFKQKLFEFYHIQNDLEVTGIMHLPFVPLNLAKILHGLLGPIYATISKHDIIYTRHSLPALVALALGKRVLLEVFQIYDQDNASGVKYLARRTNFSNSVSIITHSLPCKESLIEIGAAEKKIRFMPNGFNPDFFTPPLSKTEARKRLGWNEDDKIVCYSGRIDIDKGLDTILELAATTPEIKYVLIGYSQYDSNDWILRAANEKGLKNIKWEPWATMGELPKYLFASDVLIIPPTSKPMKYNRTVLAMKIFIYMAAGRCILAPALPDTEGVLNEKNAALVEPDNIDLAEKTIRKIFEDQAWACSIAKQAQLDSKNFTWQSRAKKIIEFLNEGLLAR